LDTTSDWFKPDDGGGARGRQEAYAPTFHFGALAMQQWGIRPLPDQEKLDMSHYSSDFLEL
jgi:hypothetical protein